MAAREMYARCSETVAGIEFIAGLEMRDDDSLEALMFKLRKSVQWQTKLAVPLFDYRQLALAIEHQLKLWWPDRAYFIEVGKENEWCQLFQPYGLPRDAS